MVIKPVLFPYLYLTSGYSIIRTINAGGVGKGEHGDTHGRRG